MSSEPPYAISAGHDRAAAIAQDVLKSGGNAVDAGVAACIALTVLHSEQVQLGGVAPMIVRMAGDGRVRVLDGVGRWPALADRLHFQTSCRGRIPMGILRTVVPAAPAAWITALERFGTMRFADLAEPAHRLAGEGFPAHRDLAETTSQFGKYYAQFPGNAAIWMPQGVPVVEGQIFRNPDLAAVLSRMIEADRSERDRSAALRAVHALFYTGSIADQMIAHVEACQGWLQRSDLAAHATRVEPAVAAEVFGGTLYSCGPWSQGPALAQALMILERYGIPPEPAAQAHAVIEAANLALSDREGHYGDPDFVDVPLAGLLSGNHAANRAAMIDPDRAFGQLPPPGLSGGWMPRTARPASGAPSLDTSVVAVVDGAGNVFAATPSDSSLDGPVVPGLGFVISTRGSQSHVEADHPAALAPGKRPRVTTCPILFRSSTGRILAGGGPGGDMQLQAMVQVLTRHLGLGEPLAAAVAAPRAFSQSVPSSSSPHVAFPGRVTVEDDMPETTVAGLTARGHKVQRAPAAGVNRASICLVGAGPGLTDRDAVGDPRRHSGQRVSAAAQGVR